MRTSYNLALLDDTLSPSTTSSFYKPEITVSKLYKRCRVGIACGSGCISPNSCSSTTIQHSLTSSSDNINTSSVMMIPSTSSLFSSSSSSIPCYLNTAVAAITTAVIASSPSSSSSSTFQNQQKQSSNVVSTSNRSVSYDLSLTATPKRISVVQFDCTYCSFSCTWKYDLKLHLRQKHGIHKKI